MGARHAPPALDGEGGRVAPHQVDAPVQALDLVDDGALAQEEVARGHAAVEALDGEGGAAVAGHAGAEAVQAELALDEGGGVAAGGYVGAGSVCAREREARLV